MKIPNRMPNFIATERDHIARHLQTIGDLWRTGRDVGRRFELKKDAAKSLFETVVDFASQAIPFCKRGGSLSLLLELFHRRLQLSGALGNEQFERNILSFASF